MQQSLCVSQPAGKFARRALFMETLVAALSCVASDIRGDRSRRRRSKSGGSPHASSPGRRHRPASRRWRRRCPRRSCTRATSSRRRRRACRARALVGHDAEQELDLGNDGELPILKDCASRRREGVPTRLTLPEPDSARVAPVLYYESRVILCALVPCTGLEETLASSSCQSGGVIHTAPNAIP